MVLACMFAEDKTAWECDMAETYGIFDYERIPVRKLATLSAGLRNDSRIMMKMAGTTISTAETLLATIADRLGIIIWQNTEDGHTGNNPPESILDVLLGRNEKQNDFMVFHTSEEFEAERNRILSQMKEE